MRKLYTKHYKSKILNTKKFKILNSTYIGFKIEDLTSAGGTQGNTNGNDHVSWTFRKQPGFFDVQTYTGDGNATKSITHDLGCKPGLILVKRTDTAADWGVYMRDSSNDSEVGVAYLNSTATFTTSGFAFTANASSITLYDNYLGSSSFSLFGLFKAL